MASRRIGIFTVLFLLSIVGLFIFGAMSYSIFQGQSFSLTDEPIYEPKFANIQCIETDRSVPDLYFFVEGSDTLKLSTESPIGDVQAVDSFTRAEGFDLYCSRGKDRVYTDECRIEIKLSPQYKWDFEGDKTVNIYKCPLYENDLNKCQPFSGTISTGVWTQIDRISRDEVLRIRNFDKSFFGFDQDFERDDLVFRSVRDEYGLVSQIGGKVEKENSCDLKDVMRVSSDTDLISSVFQQAKQDDKITGTTLEFGQSINYVWAFEPLLGSERIIEGGQYWTNGRQTKYPIVQGQSGRKYADLDNPITDRSIICDPALLYCTNEGKSLDPQFGIDKECNPDTFLITSPVPYSQKDNWVANRICVDGKIKEINPRPIPTCTGDKPVLNDEYECVAGTYDPDPEPPQDPEDLNLLPIWLAVAFGVGVAITMPRSAKEVKGR